MTFFDLLRPIVVLSALIAILVAARPLLRRWARHSMQSGDSALQIRSSLALDRSRKLTLIRCGASHVLALTGGAGDVLLPWPHAVDSTAFTVEDTL